MVCSKDVLFCVLVMESINLVNIMQERKNTLLWSCPSDTISAILFADILMVYPTNCVRTSDSLNEGLPIKMTRESFKENDIFSMNKIVGSTLDLSTKAVFSLNKYQLKIMG